MNEPEPRFVRMALLCGVLLWAIIGTAALLGLAASC